eukprot:scaffold33554_cov209-Skeletonema_dohrnii-CCMP3373.AAC.3
MDPLRRMHSILGIGIFCSALWEGCFAECLGGGGWVVIGSHGLMVLVSGKLSKSEQEKVAQIVLAP